MLETPRRVLIVGFNGGVGRAVVAALQRSAPGRRLLQAIDEVFLVDREPAPVGGLPPGWKALPPTSVEGPADLERLVCELGVRQVVDLSSIDTIDATRICDEAGASFLCTSIEEWPGMPSIPTDEAIGRLAPSRRPRRTRRRHLVGSGCNPGIVNALVFAAMEELARRVGVEPTAEALGLHSILITEEDSTREPGVVYEPDVFPMTWSPAHCLEELFEPRAFVARSGKAIDLGHRPTERLYRVRCGDRMVEGWAVPHEETTTLSWQLPGVEIAFVYRIPAAAREALARHPDWGHTAPWRLRRLLPPDSPSLEGEDRVGVLLCSRRFGELWMGFSTDVEKGRRFGSNATELQVAAGVLAGWMQLEGAPGIHLVEEIDRRAFLAAAIEILGEPAVVHDPEAPVLRLEDRVVLRRRRIAERQPEAGVRVASGA